MYSSLSDAEYQRRKARAEDDARTAYGRSHSPSVPESKPEVGSFPAAPPSSGALGTLLSRLRDDDILLIGLLFLLWNENKDDDPLILIILAVLLFT